jgi:AraC-like DNA-binding protein
MGGVLRRHRLRVHGPAQSFRAEMEHIGSPSMSMTRLSYGSAVNVEAEPEDGFWIFSLPLRGRVAAQYDGLRFDSRPGFAALISSQSSGCGTWEAGARQVIFRLQDKLLRDAAEGVGLRFDAVFSRRLLGLPIGPQLGVLPGVLDTLIRLDIEACRQVSGPLLERQWNNAASMIAQAVVSIDIARPGEASWAAQVRPGKQLLEAESWLRDRISEHKPPDVHGLARHMRMSLRAVQILVRQHRGITPHQLIEELRLRHARKLLRHSDLSVRDAAIACGFHHMGRFSASYFQLFQVAPSRDRCG